MTLYDITRPVEPGMIVFPGDPEPGIEPFHSGEFSLTRLRLTSHTGTHVDAPLHAFPGGATADSIPLERLVVPCRVICAEGPVITPGTLLSSGLREGEGILVRTAFSGYTRFSPEYPVLAPGAAAMIAGYRAPVFGTDCPSPEPPDGDGSIHRALLSAGIPILEMLALAHVTPGTYYLIALPLRVAGSDGAPVRAVLSDTPDIWTPPA